ncbi:hypothetical protein, partial [Klebsiella pneumoniae]|uniref:hypothetical protein n=1 Tax=Klebsiella pneumoniae TaxID=573 RepID=UPI001D0F39BF
KACVLPENPASYRVVRTKSYLFNKAARTLKKKPCSTRYSSEQKERIKPIAVEAILKNELIPKHQNTTNDYSAKHNPLLRPAARGFFINSYRVKSRGDCARPEN